MITIQTRLYGIFDGYRSTVYHNIPIQTAGNQKQLVIHTIESMLNRDYPYMSWDERTPTLCNIMIRKNGKLISYKELL